MTTTLLIAAAIAVVVMLTGWTFIAVNLTMPIHDTPGRIRYAIWRLECWILWRMGFNHDRIGLHGAEHWWE